MPLPALHVSRTLQFGGAADAAAAKPLRWRVAELASNGAASAVVRATVQKFLALPYADVDVPDAVVLEIVSANRTIGIVRPQVTS